jgi:DNA-binding NarL/FixJ family response regulator
MIRTVVADRSETMRLGVRALFDKHPGRFSISEAASRGDLLAKIGKEECQLVVVEPLLCGGSAEALIRQIRRLSPQANVLVYTDLDELKFGIRAIRSGAKGYLMKSCSSSELLAAASRVSAGRMHMSEALAEEVAMHAWDKRKEAPHQDLSEREMQVFSMLVCGRTVTNIGAAMHLSVKTISTHKARAMAKLGCKSLSDMVHYAISKNLKEECEARSNGW